MARLLALFGGILDSYHLAPGKGLPIGALTSQHFANHYLGYLDHAVKAKAFGCTPYVRYMDDFAFWADDRDTLRSALAHVRDWLDRELKLRLKADVPLGPTRHGMDFLGFRVFPWTVRLNQRSRRRLIAKWRRYEAAGQ